MVPWLSFYGSILAAIHAAGLSNLWQTDIAAFRADIATRNVMSHRQIAIEAMIALGPLTSTLTFHRILLTAISEFLGANESAIRELSGILGAATPEQYAVWYDTNVFDEDEC